MKNPNDLLSELQNIRREIGNLLGYNYDEQKAWLLHTLNQKRHSIGSDLIALRIYDNVELNMRFADTDRDISFCQGHARQRELRNFQMYFERGVRNLRDEVDEHISKLTDYISSNDK